jgi:hypothetical protein
MTGVVRAADAIVRGLVAYGAWLALAENLGDRLFFQAVLWL